jgi:hypothetical protein
MLPSFEQNIRDHYCLPAIAISRRPQLWLLSLARNHTDISQNIVSNSGILLFS